MKYCIYRVYKENDGMCYIGSSKKVDYIKQRLSEHKCCWKTDVKMKCSTKEIFDSCESEEEIKNVKIEILEVIELGEGETKKKIYEREDYFINFYRGKCVNKKNAVFDYKSYLERKKKKLREARQKRKLLKNISIPISEEEENGLDPNQF